MINAGTISSCPVCSTLIAFEHASSNIKECRCGAIVQKNASESGIAAPLQLSDFLHKATVRGYYIKPGTTGEWEQKRFRVLGKMGVWFEESFFSYWFIVFENGETGFLAEGYGMYAVLLPDKTGIIKSGELHNKKIGQVTTLTNYQLQKKNTSYYWEVEGELKIENASSHFQVFEFAETGGKLLTIFEWANDKINSYHNHPVGFEELNLQHTQEKNPFGKELKCPQCAKTIAIKTYPLAQSCVCGGCGVFYAIENHQAEKKGNNKNNFFEPMIALGTRGILKNIDYEVVGYAQKQEHVSESKWREYVLFNPKQGFAFLSEYDGHWIFLKETTRSPVVLNDNTREFEYADKIFSLFNSYTWKVDEAKGEFPYNIFDNKNTLVKEYISPPWIWIREKDNHEGITWFYGQHISIKEIKAAFAVTGTIPWRVGIGAVQPSGYLGIEKTIGSFLLGVLALLLIQLLFNFSKQNLVISEETYNMPDSANTVSITTEKFELSKWRSNITFDISAPVSNSWFELSASLVNTVTGDEYNMQKGVEYYSGYTDGEYWTEGNTSSTGYMTNIPAGKYFLKMEGTREGLSYGKTKNFNVKVIYDETQYRNFWFAVLLLAIWQAGSLIIGYNKEKGRWENSPFYEHKNN